MSDKTHPDYGFFRTACLFELSLALLALFLAWIFDMDPLAALYFEENSVLIGIMGTLPLFLLFIAFQNSRLEPFLRIRQILDQVIASKLVHYHWTDLLVLASIAGITEELLFRGVIQPWMENLWGYTAGLIVSNLVFGLVHAITFMYFILATLVGIYLGYFLDFSGERNLLIPIIIHAAYDFLAFVLIVKSYKSKPNRFNH